MSDDRTIEAVILASITVPEGMTVVVADPFITVQAEHRGLSPFTAGDDVLRLPAVREVVKLQAPRMGLDGLELDGMPRNRAERRKAASKR